MTNAFTTQVGGDHYKNMGMQPFQFALANNYDAACFTILKYVSRHRNKNGFQDLEKAYHVCAIRADAALFEPIRPASDFIPILKYVEVNGLGLEDTVVLADNHFWALGTSRLSQKDQALFVQAKIAHLAKTTYGKEIA